MVNLHEYASTAQHIFEPSREYLFPADADPSSINQPQFWWHRYRAMYKEFIAGRRSIPEFVRAIAEKQEPFPDHLKEGLEFVKLMDYADRAINGLGLSLKIRKDLSGPSPFGETLFRARNNPDLSDHNIEHNRRHERWIESMMLNIGSVRHEFSIREWIDSAFLFSAYHDSDQLLSLQRNTDEERPPENELKVKAGHSLAAAVMLLCLVKRYQRERLVTEEMAKKIIKGAVYMILKHDTPEELGTVLEAKEKAYTGGEMGKRELIRGAKRTDRDNAEPLREKFDKNDLDLSTLAPSQILALLTEVKRENGFLSGGQSIYGLHPEFEAEYKEELSSLLQNDEPILENIKDDEKEALRLATEIVVQADIMEMVAPAKEAIYRTLETQYSKKRDFSGLGSEKLARLRQMLQSRNILIPEGTDDVEMFYIAVTQGPGNMPEEFADADSDLRRLLWEFLHTERILESSSIAQSNFGRQAIKDAIIEGLIALRDSGERIIRGDLSHIDRDFQKRMREVTEKSLRRIAVPASERHYLRSYPDLVIGLLEEKYRKPLTAETLKKKIEKMRNQARDVKEDLRRKTQASTGMTVYSADEPSDEIERQADLFRQIVDRVILEKCRKYNINALEKKMYEYRVKRGVNNSTRPYKYYDSIAPSEPPEGKIRVLVEPLKLPVAV